MMMTVVGYAPAVRGEFVWDDDSWTTGIMGLLAGMKGLGMMWSDPTALQQYYPLTGTTFWIDYHLWGLWTPPYHVENILLHASAALLFWRLLRRLQVPGAWLAGAIFAVHPVMVESVAWITERKNVLSLVLYLGALQAYGRCTRSWKEGNEAVDWQGREWGSYAVAFVLFLGAMLAKTTAFSLPAVILLVCWWKRGRIRWSQDVVPTLPFLAVAMGLCMGTSWLEKNHVGAKGPEWDITFGERCLIAGRVLWFYAGHLAWPSKLCFIYPRWRLDAGSWIQWLYPAGAVGTLLMLWLARGRIGRGPLAGVLFFAGTLFPSLGFLNAYFMRYSFVCDHWTYLSSLGLIALAAGLAARAAGHLRTPASLYGIAAIVLAMFAILTWRQCAIYADTQTLWRDTLAKNPAAWLAHNNLGIVLRDQGKISEAIAQYEEALRFNPDYDLAHNNLGVALKDMGKLDDAMEQYQQALRISPNFPNAYYNLGVAQEILGRNNDAIGNYEHALRLDPDFFEPHYALGGLLLQIGRIQEAVEHYSKAVNIQPDSAKAHDKLAMALTQQGNLEEAIKQWDEVLRIEPDNFGAHYNLGFVLEKSGKDDAAIGQYEEAIRLKPDFFQPHYNLGGILLRLGEIQEAVEHYNEAVNIQPDSAEAHSNLALALWQAGQLREAIKHWELALRIEPDYPEAQNDLAWLLATLKPAEGGDPVRAVSLAERACNLTGYQMPRDVDTLAAAYAAAGRFNDAVATAQKAIDLARSAGQSQLVGEIQARLLLYHSGRAYSRSPDISSPHNP
jgi:tetratricopeptide (TPR) repeat protein